VIVVTGTKRSGTSLWMQLLSSAGYRFIGDMFPRNWEEKLRAANPRGFYESELRNGIHWQTNPHPKTGRFLHPDQVRQLLVKVFVPGLTRSDMAYLDHVVASIRPWRDVVRSIRRMREIEAEVFAWAEQDRQPGFYPPDVEWLRENFLLVRDLRLRRYPHVVVAHSQLMRDPHAQIGRVLDFIGAGAEHLQPLAERIDPELHRNRQTAQVSTLFDDQAVELIDTWMSHVDEGRWDHPDGLKALDAAWKRAHEQGWFKTKYRWDQPPVRGQAPAD